MKPRRPCAVCGKRRIGAYFLTSYNRKHHKGTSSPPSYTSGSDPRFWPIFRGWLCREHSTLDDLSAGLQCHADPEHGSPRHTPGGEA